MTRLDHCLVDNLAWLKVLLAQQENLIVPENRTGLFPCQVIHTATLATSEFAVMNWGITKLIIYNSRIFKNDKNIYFVFYWKRKRPTKCTVSHTFDQTKLICERALPVDDFLVPILSSTACKVFVYLCQLSTNSFYIHIFFLIIYALPISSLAWFYSLKWLCTNAKLWWFDYIQAWSSPKIFL